MKNAQLFLVPFLLLTACRKKFPAALLKAESSYAEKNYINTIDTLNRTLPDWKESDGNDKKARAYELLGQSYHQLRNIDKATEAYKQAIQLSNKSYFAAYSLGNLFLLKGKPEEARQAFQKALQMKPDDPQALLGLGNSEFELRDIPAATASFEKVLDVSPAVREALESLNVIKNTTHKGLVSKTAAPKKNYFKKR